MIIRLLNYVCQKRLVSMNVPDTFIWQYSQLLAAKVQILATNHFKTSYYHFMQAVSQMFQTQLVYLCIINKVVIIKTSPMVACVPLDHEGVGLLTLVTSQAVGSFCWVHKCQTVTDCLLGLCRVNMQSTTTVFINYIVPNPGTETL